MAEPVAGPSLEEIVGERKRLMAALDQKTAQLRAAVLVALDGGAAEAALARRTGLSRMTVREWRGKPYRRRKSAG